MKEEEQPSEQEVKEHMINHMPFRSWCPFCIKGKAGSNAHRKRSEDESGVPVISIDYAFMGKGMDDQEREKEVQYWS